MQETESAHGLNFDYFHDRLEDRTLLDRAVVVVGGRDTAVPVGGKRRGGFVTVDGAADAAAVIAQLAQFDGFPDLRAEIAPPDADWCDSVHWGDDLPVEPADDDPLWTFALWDIELGRYYGYADYVIREFVAQQWGRLNARRAWRQLENTRS